MPAIEEAIFAGVPVNVTLLFSREQYLAAPRHICAASNGASAPGSTREVGSVASVFISRWDAAVAGKVPEALNNQLGIAIARRTYKAYLDLLEFATLATGLQRRRRSATPAVGQHGDQGPKGVRYALHDKTLAAPFTVNTMPEATLKAFADHGEVGASCRADGGDSEEVLAQFAQAGVNVELWRLNSRTRATKSFVKSWNELMAVIASKSTVLRRAA